jgi:hypothetical protein
MHTEKNQVEIFPLPVSFSISRFRLPAQVFRLKRPCSGLPAQDSLPEISARELLPGAFFKVFFKPSCACHR